MPGRSGRWPLLSTASGAVPERRRSATCVLMLTKEVNVIPTCSALPAPAAATRSPVALSATWGERTICFRDCQILGGRGKGMECGSQDVTALTKYTRLPGASEVRPWISSETSARLRELSDCIACSRRSNQYLDGACCRRNYRQVFLFPEWALCWKCWAARLQLRRFPARRIRAHRGMGHASQGCSSRRELACGKPNTGANAFGLPPVRFRAASPSTYQYCRLLEYCI